jgi:hypothetical protein
MLNAIYHAKFTLSIGKIVGALGGNVAVTICVLRVAVKTPNRLFDCI